MLNQDKAKAGGDKTVATIWTNDMIKCKGELSPLEKEYIDTEKKIERGDIVMLHREGGFAIGKGLVLEVYNDMVNIRFYDGTMLSINRRYVEGVVIPHKPEDTPIVEGDIIHFKKSVLFSIPDGYFIVLWTREDGLIGIESMDAEKNYYRIQSKYIEKIDV